MSTHRTTPQVSARGFPLGANGTDGFRPPLDLAGEIQLGAVAFIEDDCISRLRNYKSEIIDFRVTMCVFAMGHSRRRVRAIPVTVAQDCVSPLFVALTSLWRVERCRILDPVQPLVGWVVAVLNFAGFFQYTLRTDRYHSL